MSKVFVINANYQNIKSVIDEIFKQFPLDLKNRKVWIKPNLIGKFPPQQGATTHPDFVKSVLEYVTSYTEDVIVGDNSGLGYGINEEVAEITGIKKVSGKYYKNISISGKKILCRSRFFKELLVSDIVTTADIVISLPKFKTHLQTVITGGIKNMFGMIIGSLKTKIHSLAPGIINFSEAIVDIYQCRIPDLVIMDGIIGMEGDGPSNGIPRHIGKVLASFNSVDLDTVMSKMMGFAPDKIPLLNIAYKRELGKTINNIRIDGDFEIIRNFKPPSTFIFRHPLGDAISLLTPPLPQLTVDNSKCTRCFTCKKVCPQGAIQIFKTVKIDKDKCILCYCCNEICPEGAIKLKFGF